METVYTGFTAMFKVGVTNIEDARRDSNKSRFHTSSIYILRYIDTERLFIISHEARIELVQYRVLFSLDICGSLVRRTEVVFYSTPPSVEAGGLTPEVKRSISPIITGVNLKVTFFLRVGMIVEAEAATFLGLPRRRVTGGGGSG